MKKSNQTDLKKYRKALEALSSRVRSDANGMVEQVRSGSGGNGGSDLSNAPFHLGDMGTDEFLYDMNATLLVNEQYIVAEAREALNRLDNGTYGICESCGQSIASARLEAIPFTRFCVKCAEANDQTPQVSLDEGRPHSPKDTLAPEGEMDEDRVTTRQFARVSRRRASIAATSTRPAQPAAAQPSADSPAATKAAATRSSPNSTKQPPAATSTSKTIASTTARHYPAAPAAQSAARRHASGQSSAGRLFQSRCVKQ